MNPSLGRLPVLVSLALGCGDDVSSSIDTDTEGETEPAATTGSSGEGTTGTSTTDATDESSSSGDDVTPPSLDWCDRVVAGPPGDVAELDLAVAHANIRFFGTEADYQTVDAALAETLAPAVALASIELAAYDDALESVCTLPASDATLGPATVVMDGMTAWVRPGTGAVELPAATQAVVLDLRELPNVPELEAALLAALAPALATAYERPLRRVRRHNGHVDQYNSEGNIYTTEVAELTSPPIAPTGAEDLPLAVVTGERLPPAAAELAGSLRLQQRAWLVGHDVYAQVAESWWNPIGETGAAWRYSDLHEWGTARWPNRTLADVITDDPEADVDELFAAGKPPAPNYDGGARSIVQPYDPWSASYEPALGLGQIRAALLIAYGVVELFFPYFDDVGHSTDDALLELLAEAQTGDADDRALMTARLRRFSSALQDGHARVFDLYAEPQTGVISARVEAFDGYPVVRRSNQPGLLPGDTIVEIEGEPALSWYEARHELVSAASDGYRHAVVTSMLTRRSEPIEVTIESAIGVSQSRTLEPIDLLADEEFGRAPVDRPSGWLDDLGSPSLYYLNMSNTDTDDALAGIAAAIDIPATGMVVDMRGYPGLDHYAVVPALVPGPFESPRFQIPVRTGPAFVEDEEEVYPFDGTAAYDGQMVLLVGNHTLSAAENFSIMLVGADRVTVVGQQSASTNGNISGIQLPGGFALTFTGLRVLFPDSSQFHGVGIVPDIEVVPDPAAYANGEDPELLVAIATLES